MEESRINVIKSQIGILSTGEHTQINIDTLNITNSSPTEDVKSTNADFRHQKLLESFEGRDTELEQLTSWFESVNMVVISGLPGFGKTELARQFVRQYKNNGRVHYILWIDAETRASLEQSFRDLLRWLRDTNKAELDIHSVVQAVHQHFRDQPHMFVFDNAADRRSVADFEPEGKWKCLVTSHVQDWGDDVPSLPLQPLNLEASLSVLRAELRDYFNEQDIEHYKLLAEMLSYVPLALQVNAAYIRQEMRAFEQVFNLSSYVQELQNSYKFHMNKPFPTFSKNAYKISIHDSLKKSLDKIRNINDECSCLALQILHICAYCNPSQISFSFLEKLLLTEFQENILIKSLYVISNYLFIQIDHDTKKFTMHRLIQEILISFQSELPQSDHNLYYFACLKFLSDNYPSTHSHYMLKHIETHVKTFQYFYSKFADKIINKSAFLYNLTENGCRPTLELILNELDSRAAGTINAHNLLNCAILCRQHELLKMFLERGAYVDQRDENKDTPLFTSAFELNLPAIQILTSHKADVNATSRLGDSALHVIVFASGLPQHISRSAEALEAFRWLVETGARTDAVSPRGDSLLHLASYSLNIEFIRCLVLEYHLDVNVLDRDDQTPLHHVNTSSACDRNTRLRAAEMLLKLGARTDIVNKYDNTPADLARLSGLDYLAQYLENPAAGYEIRETSPDVDALRAAAAAGDSALLTKLLFEKGECAVEAAKQSFLIHVAAEHGQHKVLKLLLEHDFPVDSRDDLNNTALFIAAEELDLPAVQTLVSHGADVNAIGTYDYPVLCYFFHQMNQLRHVGRGSEACKILRWLVSQGARTDCVTPEGDTLLHLAASALNCDLVRCLVTEIGIDVNVVGENDRTPLFRVSHGLSVLHAEVSRGVNVAACLVDLGATVDVVDAQGLTPADYARARGHEQLANFLDNPATWQMLQATWWERIRDACVRGMCSCRRSHSQYHAAPTQDIQI